MKKQLIALGTVLLLALTACGGKEGSPPPPVDLGCGGGGGGGGGGGPEPLVGGLGGGGCGSADDAASYALLQQQVKQALDQCTSNVRMFAIITAQQMYQQPGASIQQIQQQPQYQQQLTQPATAQENSCTTATNNFLLNLMTMKNGQYIQRPDVQEWVRLAFFAPLGDRAVQGFPPQQLLDPNFRNGLMTAGTQYFDRMSSLVDPRFRGLTANASSFLTQFK